jgi:Mrp family chromosome partitioning ATPase
VVVPATAVAAVRRLPRWGFPLVDLVDYVKLLRRRWQIPVICLVVGALLGWSTGPSEAELVVDEGEFYRATSTLTFNPPIVDDQSGESLITLQQIAFKVSAGDVPQEVAAEMATSAGDIQDHVQGVPAEQFNALYVMAIGEDPATTARMADITADELTTAVNEEVETRYTSRLQALEESQREFQAQIDELRAGGLSERETPEYDSLNSDLRAVDERLRQWRRAGAPSVVLTSVERARPISIEEGEYTRLRQTFLRDLGDPNEAPAEDPNAVEDEGPSKPISSSARGLMGGFLGLVLGVGIVMGLDRFDTRLRTKRATEEAFGLPVIAEVPPLSHAQKKRSEILVRTSPRSRLAEAYRAVRTSILFVAASGAQVGVGVDGAGRALDRGTTSAGPRPWLREERGEALTVLVSSPGPEEGKTSTTANVASLLAEAGMRVLVVNCDYRRPRIHRYFEGREVPTPGEDRAVPMPESNDERTNEQLDVVRGARIIDTSVPGVRLVTGIGEDDPDANPAQVVGAQRKIVEVARRHFDVILLDTAPLLTTNDAVEILSEADLIVLTCRYGRTKREQAELASELLERLSAPVVGVVFVESPDAPQAQYYYYYLDPSGSRRDRRRDEDEVGEYGDAEATVTSLRDVSGS